MHFQRIVTFLAFLTLGAAAYNHPEIEWQSVTTEHFIINFYDKTEPAVYAAWKISEGAFATLSTLFDYEPRDKITLSLADYDDFSNGYAEWTAANIMIWIPDSRFDLRSNTTWLRNVITHELTHIITLEQKKRMQTVDLSIGLSVSTPDEEYGVAEPFAKISTYPSWVMEGIAQYETELLGNDCFDSRREMVLRGAVLSDRMLSLDEMGDFNHDYWGNELVYNQGYAFTKYIAGKIGLARLRAFFTACAEEPRDFMHHFSNQTGMSLRALYDTWADSLHTAFTARFAGLTDDAPTALSGDGRFNLRPAVSPDGRYCAWLSSGRDDGGRTDLIVTRTGEIRPLYRIPYAHTAHCFSSKSDRIFFIKSRTPNNHGSYLNDLFSLSLSNGERKRLTVDGRIYDVAAVPGEQSLLCIGFRKGAFGLYRCPIDGGPLTELIPGELGAPLVNISVNPENPSIIVMSKIVDGRSRLFRWTEAEKKLEPISPGGAQEESPFWAPEGRIYYSADYDGVFNIYSLLPDGSDLQRHTTTAGGFFSPQIGPAGRIIASHYHTNRFSIVEPAPAADPYTVTGASRCSFSPLPRPQGVVTVKSRPYRPKLRRGIWEVQIDGRLMRNGSIFTGQEIPSVDSIGLIVTGGFSNYRSDALQKRQRLVRMLIGVQKIVTGKSASAPDGNDHQKGVPVSFLPSIKAEAPSRFTERTAPAGLRTSLTRPATELFFINHYRQQQASGDQSDSSATEPPFYFAALPTLAFENRYGVPTIGVEISTEMAMMLLPRYISVAPYIEFQLAREWFCGAAATLMSMPFSGYPFFCSMPFYLVWSHTGYINEDLYYNMADYTEFHFAAGPRFLPGSIISFENDSTDTIMPVVGGWMAQIDLFHGIPLFKYGSLQLRSSTVATYHGERTLDDRLFSTDGTEDRLLDGMSNSYLLSVNGLMLVFPIVRTINRGSRNYFDALYGHAGYRLFTYANSGFFDRPPENRHRLFSDPGYRQESVFLDHALSAGIELGRCKSHLFFSSIAFEFSYWMLRSSFRLSLTSGF
ncbi:MAG: PD40 domain-containing protein [Chitinispirillaceae bacterium]|nr:PD40 domain-containing protein [Chitinispirillaceae bacterium]